MHTCPTCKGSKKINVEVHEKSTVSHVEIGCVYCNETGTMNDEQLARYQRMQDMWCNCNSPSDRHRSWGKDIECMDCGGVVCIG